MRGDNIEVIYRKKRASRNNGISGGSSGSWKIAFADFMTAMMALFLLLWLVSITTEEQRRGIADFFNPMAIKESGSGGATDEGGADVSGELVEIEIPEIIITEIDEPEDQVDKEAIDEAANAEFLELVEEIKERMSAAIDLEALAENIIIEVVDEGLRIQITDREGAPMFPTGSTGMTDTASDIVRTVASTVEAIPNHLAITGHTDSVPYRSDTGFDNWDLSSGRANTARRILMSSGIEVKRISRVEGLADTDHFISDSPNHPRNRRISITVLR